MNPQIAIDLKAAWPFIWTVISAVFGWLFLRLTRQFDGHSEKLDQLERAAHEDRLHGSRTYAAKDEIRDLRHEIKSLDKKIDDNFAALFREIRKP